MSKCCIEKTNNNFSLLSCLFEKFNTTIKNKFYLSVFCFGHLIHSGLNLGQKILYLTADDGAFEACTCMSDVIASVLQPVYAFYNLFFVYKYSNVRPTCMEYEVKICATLYLTLFDASIIIFTSSNISKKYVCHCFDFA